MEVRRVVLRAGRRQQGHERGEEGQVRHEDLPRLTEVLPRLDVRICLPVPPAGQHYKGEQRAAMARVYACARASLRARHPPTYEGQRR